MAQLWALVSTVKALVDLVNRIWNSWVDYQLTQMDEAVDKRAAERLALAKAMSEATDDQQRIRLARLYHRLDSPRPGK